ncbi:hypothetical protein [Butyrivibrio sp. AE3004]|uniref:hypothetical protein n=1 Tax=Butyrivibrio sp. AE3004 TaxID=1506994 RepID=UPI000493CA00|nr:hypothetical protein [Butyrivibrio sp. AE3004]
MLSIEELSDLEDAIMEVLPDKITQILSRANRNGELDELLRIMGLSDLLGSDDRFESFKDGKIVVIGGTEVKEEVLSAIGKQLGIDKKRFEFCLDYKEAQKYDFKKMQYAPQYRVILFGPTPHSGHGKEDSSSIIAELEKTEAYPRVERLISGQELKITKTSFRQKLQQLIDEEYI